MYILQFSTEALNRDRSPDTLVYSLEHVRTRSMCVMIKSEDPLEESLSNGVVSLGDDGNDSLCWEVEPARD
ncbi:hypothetical protein TSUD_316840 [Trifolium subterraneum]|uniref:Uncharacterized protein n=1 Tax=Trifolium subterraneum TaxID=3900 RepID=A0A2Z6NR87_TRISU|nr:hypothetical protein TSUD_316840 [Trifolium subterraneum]